MTLSSRLPFSPPLGDAGSGHGGARAPRRGPPSHVLCPGPPGEEACGGCACTCLAPLLCCTVAVCDPLQEKGRPLPQRRLSDDHDGVRPLN